MDVQAVMDRRVAALPRTLDAAIAEDLRELVSVGEADVALVLMIEDAPELVDAAFVDQVEEHYSGSDDYNEPFALDAVAKYRQQLTV